MLNKKVVLVTGGAGLIGSEFVKSIVRNNGIAIIGEIDLTIAEKLKQELLKESKDYQIGIESLDITSLESVQKALASIKKQYGKLDALVNNAYPRNKNYGKHFFDVEYKDFCENISLNLGGYFLISQQVAKLFKEQKYGNIVNISSIYGVIPPKFEIYDDTEMTMPVEYAAIKSALINLTKYMAKYFKGSNIRVNALSPGGVLNNQPEKFLQAYKKQSLNKGMLDPKDLTGTLLFLLSDASANMNGQNIVVDDGFSL